jgi:hypothetical protein
LINEKKKNRDRRERELGWSDPPRGAIDRQTDFAARHPTAQGINMQVREAQWRAGIDRSGRTLAKLIFRGDSGQHPLAIDSFCC